MKSANCLHIIFYLCFYRMSIPEPTSYISRHEEFIEQQLINVSSPPSPELEQKYNNMNLNSTTTDNVSQGSSGSQYLQEVLGDVLVIFFSWNQYSDDKEKIFVFRLKPYPKLPKKDHKIQFNLWQITYTIWNQMMKKLTIMRPKRSKIEFLVRRKPNSWSEIEILPVLLRLQKVRQHRGHKLQNLLHQIKRQVLRFRRYSYLFLKNDNNNYTKKYSSSVQI